jgi:hypothetical protein
MKVFIKILITPLFLISCRNTNITNNQNIITFNLTERPNITAVKLSDLGFVDIEYILLETNEQSVVHEINEIMFNDIIFGNDYFITYFFTQIHVFRYDGSFVARIGTVGRGPNEFTFVHDVDIDKKSQFIYLVDGWRKKFFVYSERGEFIRTFQVPLSAASEFKIIDSKILCYNRNHLGNIENSFVLMDTLGGIIKNFPNRYPFINKHSIYGAGQENLFYRFNNLLFKKEVYSDTIYLFDGRDFKPHLIIDVGDRLLTPKARSEFDGMYLAKNYITPLNLFEFGDYIYYEFTYEFKIYGDDVCGFIGSKKAGFQAFINPKQGFVNDLDGGPNIWPKTIKDDNTIIGMVNALQLKSHVASEAFKNSTPKFPEKKKELEKLAKSLKETDNPVLMLVRLKK